LPTKLFRNISYLGLSQIANYLFPLITIPYITRVVGPENYGLIEFASVTMVYFIGVVDYSFNTTATRRLAGALQNQTQLQLVFSAVMRAKGWLLLVASLLFGLLLLTIPAFRAKSFLLAMAFPVVLGWALYPTFLLRGVQKLGVVAVANLIIKGAAAALIFAFLQEPDQYYLVPFFTGLTQLLVGLWALIYSLQKVPGLRFMRVPRRAVRFVFWEGRFVFLSLFMARIYGFGSIFIGGFLLSSESLGLLAAAAKLITVAQSTIFQPLQGALFPHLSQYLKQDFATYRSLHRRSLVRLLMLTGLASLGVFLLAPWLVELIFGPAYRQAVPLLRIMAPMLLVGSVAHMSLQQGLLLLRQDRFYLYIIAGAALLSVALNFSLMPLLGMTGGALSKLVVEALLAGGAALFFYRNLPLHAPR
jgi:PST family polysaccharide transporter